jgi:mxaJ protein
MSRTSNRWPVAALLALTAPSCARPPLEPPDRAPPSESVPLASASTAGPDPAHGTRVLRVCADPNNLPFSNQRLEGFENRIAALLARELDAEVSYTWWAQRRGFFRNTLKARLCDVVIGVPKGIDMVATTDAFYRSRYVFVTRAGEPRPRSFDDPALRRLRIGVHVIGDDYANSPPVHALSRRNIVDNLTGYRLLGDYAEESPPARAVDAVAAGDVDVAVVWGPLGGYFAARAGNLAVSDIEPTRDEEALPMTYDMAFGVRHGERAFLAELNRALANLAGEIRSVLSGYHVPVIAMTEAP